MVGTMARIDPRKALPITLEQYNELEDRMMGLCIACRTERSGCEPDARRYECEACGEKEVYGPHEFLMRGLVT
jgi:hypothetical protein